jgi:hypothetical protein
MFHLVTTLCQNGGTLEVMVRSEDIFVLLAIPNPILEANRTKVSKVQGFGHFHDMYIKFNSAKCIAFNFGFHFWCLGLIF